MEREIGFDLTKKFEFVFLKLPQPIYFSPKKNLNISCNTFSLSSIRLLILQSDQRQNDLATPEQ